MSDSYRVPFPHYHQGFLAKKLGISRSEMAKLANNPIEAVQIPDGSGGLVWVFNCYRADEYMKDL